MCSECVFESVLTLLLTFTASYEASYLFILFLEKSWLNFRICFQPDFKSRHTAIICNDKLGWHRQTKHWQYKVKAVVVIMIQHCRKTVPCTVVPAPFHPA